LRALGIFLPTLYLPSFFLRSGSSKLPSQDPSPAYPALLSASPRGLFFEGGRSESRLALAPLGACGVSRFLPPSFRSSSGTCGLARLMSVPSFRIFTVNQPPKFSYSSYTLPPSQSKPSHQYLPLTKSDIAPPSPCRPSSPHNLFINTLQLLKCRRSAARLSELQSGPRPLQPSTLA